MIVGRSEHDLTPALMVLYFGYGANMHIELMNKRCPDNKLLGSAVLRDWRWIINQRRWANVIPSPGDHVYALLYELNANDEQSLDGYEDVPRSYGKQTLSVEWCSADGTIALVNAVVYVDHRQTEGVPWPEYVGRINHGIVDALQHGMPQEYVDKYLRRFIPATGAVDFSNSTRLSSPVQAAQLSSALAQLVSNE
ncbi:hypothetical protein HMN09_00041800 [Mycena chlorophos]|uniref:gamma-glutamylcyclotransferase n=1 Tax=Mycena chlorophos TaxID=658473 RepID=A0A8H6TP99_MYCCL|nr:hypothetical protein HMN09_00041800 [Mycena chlorophos]